MFVLMVYAGDPADGPADRRPLPRAGDSHRRPRGTDAVSGIYEFSAEAENPMPAITRSLFANRALDDEQVERIVARLSASDRPDVAITQIRVLGGEMARVAADASAFAHRDAR